MFGTPCPADGPVERANIVVLGTGFDDLNEEVLQLSLRDETHRANSYYGGVRVTEGAFEATFYRIFNDAEGDYSVFLWIDDDQSRDCSDADRVWSYEVPPLNEEGEAVVTAVAGGAPGVCPAEE